MARAVSALSSRPLAMDLVRFDILDLNRPECIQADVQRDKGQVDALLAQGEQQLRV